MRQLQTIKKEYNHKASLVKYNFKHFNDLKEGLQNASELKTLNLDMYELLQAVWAVLEQAEKKEAKYLEDPIVGILNDIGDLLYAQNEKLIKTILDGKESKLITKNGNLNAELKKELKDQINQALQDFFTEQNSDSSSTSSSAQGIQTISDQKLKNIVVKFLEGIQKSIVKTLEGYYKTFSSNDVIVNNIMTLILGIDKKYDDDYNVIAQYMETKENNLRGVNAIPKPTADLLDRLRKELQTETDKHDKRTEARGMSFKDMFMENLKNNATFTRKSNKVFYQYVTIKFNYFKSELKRQFKQKILRPFLKVRRSMKKTNIFMFLLLATLNGIGLSLKLASGLIKFSFKFMKGVFKLGVKTVKFAFGVIKKAFSAVKNFVVKGVRGITRRISSLYHFMKDNTFMKRMYKFLRSDAGAVFLGFTFAFLKNAIFIPLIHKIMNIRIGIKLEGWSHIFDYDDIQFKLADENNNLAQMFIWYHKLASFLIKFVSGSANILSSIFTKENWWAITRIITWVAGFVKVIGNLTLFATKYRFTTLAVRFSARCKNIWLILGALLIGALTDLILNATGGGVITSTAEKIFDIKGFNLNFGTKTSYADKTYTLGAINNIMQDPKDKESMIQEFGELDRFITDIDRQVKEHKDLFSDQDADTFSEQNENFNKAWLRDVYDMATSFNIGGEETPIRILEHDIKWFTDKASPEDRLDFVKALGVIKSNYLIDIKNQLNQDARDGKGLRVGYFKDILTKYNRDYFIGKSKEQGYQEERSETFKVSHLQDLPFTEFQTDVGFDKFKYVLGNFKQFRNKTTMQEQVISLFKRMRETEKSTKKTYDVYYGGKRHSIQESLIKMSDLKMSQSERDMIFEGLLKAIGSKMGSEDFQKTLGKDDQEYYKDFANTLKNIQLEPDDIIVTKEGLTNVLNELRRKWIDSNDIKEIYISELMLNLNNNRLR